MKELHLSIVSPEKSVFDGDVKIVTLPGTIGSFSILPGHAPIVSSLKAGTLSYTTLDGEEIGRVTKVTYSYVLNKNIGCAIVDNSKAGIGTKVQLHGFEAVLCDKIFC